MAKELNKFAHPEYIKMLGAYKRIRDCYDGEDAIKAAAEVYLPKLTGQTPQDYANYKYRALFFPITGKTCSSMVGMALTKPPKLEYPELLEAYFVDSESGYQFTEFTASTISEIVLMGRYGVLIDAPEAPAEGDPYFVPYRAENIVNWSVDDDTGKLTMLLLKECVDEEVEGQKFERKTVIRYRHCFLQGGIYHYEILDEDLDVTKPASAPVFSGSTIDFIPYIPFGSSGVHIHVDKPPMQDISTINISHYLTSADLEWGRHIVGLPTPVVSGVDSGTSLKIGGTSAWVLPVVEAKAYYLEFLGQGLGSLEKAMTDKVALMSTMSARLVDSSTRGSEAAETVRLRYMSESASLIHIITAVESGFNMLYNMLAKLKKIQEKVSIKFSREILGTQISFKDLAVLFEAYLNGSISKETLLYNLRRLDAIDPNRSDEDELGAIKEPPTPTVKQPLPAGAQ